jgi:hypothetical protein
MFTLKSPAFRNGGQIPAKYTQRNTISLPFYLENMYASRIAIVDAFRDTFIMTRWRIKSLNTSWAASLSPLPWRPILKSG